jgi:diaminopimelate epimerase
MSEPLHFEKWQGTGNDFVLVSQSVVDAHTDSIPALAKAMCDRHFGVGSDGLIAIGRGESARFRMRMWNPDGSEAELCGNGLRCVGAQLLSAGIVDGSGILSLETGKGPVNIDFPAMPEWAGNQSFWVRVDLGKPGGDIRVRPGVEENLRIPGIEALLKFVPVDMGNPHAVIFVDDLSRVPVETLGPIIENFAERFPSRTNVEFVQVIAGDRVKMRVWERGAGLTLSCGSGTAAIQVACHLTGKARDRLRVDVPGGTLSTEYTEDGRVLLSGPAERVFAGEWPG